MPVPRLVILTLVLSAFVPVAIAVASNGATTIRLQQESGAPGPEIRLAQIADLEGPLSETLGAIVVGRFVSRASDDGDADAVVELRAVREALNAHDVHWGRVTLGGFARCKVHRFAPVPGPERAAPMTEPAANPDSAVSRDRGVRLRDLVEAELRQRFGPLPSPRSTLVVHFDERDQARLRTLLDEAEIEIAATGPVGPGSTPLTITRRTGIAPPQRIHVTAEIRLETPAVCAVRPVARGQTLTPGDVAVSRIQLDRRRAITTDPSAVIGRVAESRLLAGDPIELARLEDAAVIERGDALSLRWRRGKLEVRLTGSALEDGAVGQVIAVRNSRSRQPVRARVLGPGLAVIVEPHAEPAGDSAAAGEGSHRGWTVVERSS